MYSARPGGRGGARGARPPQVPHHQLGPCRALMRIIIDLTVVFDGFYYCYRCLFIVVIASEVRAAH